MLTKRLTTFIISTSPCPGLPITNETKLSTVALQTPFFKKWQFLTFPTGGPGYLGSVSLPVSVVEKHGEIIKQWANLKNVSSGRVLMSLSWLAITKDKPAVLGGIKH